MQRTTAMRRRTLIKLFSGALLAAGVGLRGRISRAQQRVNPEDPAARALAFTQRSANPDKTCSGCRFYAEPGAEWAGCSVFAGKQVPAGGHCTAWSGRT